MNKDNIKELKKEKRIQKNKSLPSYTLGEELFNAISHIVGAVMGLVVLIVGLVITIPTNDAIKIVSAVILAIGIMLLYIASSIYHFLPRNSGKRVFRILDHCAIFVMIAATYTPYCLITLKDSFGIYLLIAVYVLAILGIVFNSVFMYNKTVKKLSMVLYLLLGWCIIFMIIPLFNAIALNGFILLVLGGVLYTIGAVFYAFGKKKKYIHSVWHLFVLFGSLLQCLSILIYVF